MDFEKRRDGPSKQKARPFVWTGLKMFLVPQAGIEPTTY